MDVQNCYVILFKDQAGTVYSVPFDKDDPEGNRKASVLVNALQKVGPSAEKYRPVGRPDKFKTADTGAGASLS